MSTLHFLVTNGTRTYPRLSILYHNIHHTEIIAIGKDRHLLAIIALKRRRNALLPVSRLPPEVLSAVFLLVVKYERSYDSTGDWTHVLAVCKHWRDVGLHEPTLWAYWGTFKSPTYLPIFAARSEAASLYIKICFHEGTNPSFIPSWKALSSDSSICQRVRELDVHFEGEDSSVLDPFGDTLSTACIPQMQRLRLFIGYHRGFRHYRLPAAFTTCKFPQLSYLERWQCGVDWAALIFDTSTLTHLVIARTTKHNSPTLLRVREILSNKSMLKVLNLDLDENQESSVNLQMPMIELRHLREVQLIGSLGSCLNVMDSILYSRNLIQVSLSFETKAEAAHGHFLPWLFRYYHYDRPPPVGHLSLVVRDSHELELGIWHEEFQKPYFATIKRPPNTSIRMNLESIVTTESLNNVVATMLAGLPLVDLRTVSVVGAEMTPSEWRFDVFSLMPC